MNPTSLCDRGSTDFAFTWLTPIGIEGWDQIAPPLRMCVQMLGLGCQRGKFCDLVVWSVGSL